MVGVAVGDADVLNTTPLIVIDPRLDKAGRESLPFAFRRGNLPSIHLAQELLCFHGTCLNLARCYQGAELRFRRRRKIIDEVLLRLP